MHHLRFVPPFVCSVDLLKELQIHGGEEEEKVGRFLPCLHNAINPLGDEEAAHAEDEEACCDCLFGAMRVMLLVEFFFLGSWKSLALCVSCFRVCIRLGERKKGRRVKG